MTDIKYAVFFPWTCSNIGISNKYMCLCGRMLNLHYTPDCYPSEQELFEDIDSFVCKFDNLNDVYDAIIKAMCTSMAMRNYIENCRLYKLDAHKKKIEQIDFNLGDIVNYCNNMKNQILSLQNQNTLLENMLSYQPDGTGALEAQTHFESLNKKN